MTLVNRGRPYRIPRSNEWWPRGEEREVSDDLAARLLTTGRFSVVAPLVHAAPVAVVPVTKAAAKPKPKRRRKKA